MSGFHFEGTDDNSTQTLMKVYHSRDNVGAQSNSNDDGRGVLEVGANSSGYIYCRNMIAYNRVGIGANNPSYPLQVWGQVRFSGGDTDEAIHFNPDIIGESGQKALNMSRNGYQSLEVYGDGRITTPKTIEPRRLAHLEKRKPKVISGRQRQSLHRRSKLASGGQTTPRWISTGASNTQVTFQMIDLNTMKAL